MSSGRRFLDALCDSGLMGQRAAGRIEGQSATIREINAALTRERDRTEKAERQVRDQAREIERLNRKVAELQSKPKETTT